jgi:hypothetical protein
MKQKSIYDEAKEQWEATKPVRGASFFGIGAFEVIFSIIGALLVVWLFGVLEIRQIINDLIPPL